MALQLMGPVRVAKVIRVGGKEGTVALYIKEPPVEWLEEVHRAYRKKGKARANALERCFAPERLAPLVERWEGVADADDRPVPCSPEAVVAACKAHRVMHGFLVEAVEKAWAREVEGNSEASPAGSTGEAPRPAEPADAPGPAGD